MHDLKFFRNLIEEELKKIPFNNEPQELYTPIRYIISLGGKRLRPALLLMATKMFGGDFKKALSPALAIEVFHNFTLLHDDIMDKAPLRRAQQTVHKKWNENVAILSGDAIFVKSVQLMMKAEENILREAMEIFCNTALQVCEGQQLDMNFESRIDVTIEEYEKMISLKTSALVAASLEIGAVAGGANRHDAKCMYEFGKNLGIAFQLHDDLLDVYADAGKFGKQNGGDIITNKKTFLLLKALELATGKLSEELHGWMDKKEFNETEKISAVKEIYDSLNIREHTEKEMDRFYKTAIQQFDSVSLSEERKKPLLEFAEMIMVREV